MLGITGSSFFWSLAPSTWVILNPTFKYFYSGRLFIPSSPLVFYCPSVNILFYLMYAHFNVCTVKHLVIKVDWLIFNAWLSRIFNILYVKTQTRTIKLLVEEGLVVTFQDKCTFTWTNVLFLMKYLLNRPVFYLQKISVMMAYWSSSSNQCPD